MNERYGEERFGICEAEQELMKCLVKGEQSATEEGWISADEVEAVLRVNE